MPKESWEPKPATGAGRRGGRWLRRIAWTAAALLLLAWLGWLLVTPFVHPRTHLVLLSGDVVSVDASPAAVPADYVIEDLRELLRLKDVLHQGLLDQPATPLVLGSLNSADEMQQLADRLNERVTGRGDVMLIYVSAHGLTQDGDAWLLASGANWRAPLGGRYRLSSLLAQLRQCRAATKVLLLEAGRLDYDPLRGLLDNDFPCRLADQVHELGDPSLWVLVSHGAAQRSHLSPALRRSVFGYFLSVGLSGAADADQDRAIDLGELNEFVTSGVAGWVRETTGGAAQQTPVLLWGGGEVPPSRSLPMLLAVPRKSSGGAAAVPAVDHSQSVAKAQASPATSAELQEEGRRELDELISRSVVRATPQGQLGQYINETVQSLLAQAGGAAEPPADESKAANSAKDSQETATAAKDAAAADVAGGPPPPAEPKVTVEPKSTAEASKVEQAAPPAKTSPAGAAAQPPQAAPAAPPITAAERAALAAQLDRAWRLRDELIAADRPAARPLDYAPHLWRQLESRLLVLDRRLRTGYLPAAAELAAPLADLIETLQAIAAPAPPATLAADSLAGRINAARPGQALANVEPRSIALAERSAADGGPPLSAELARLAGQLDRLIAAGNRTDLEALAKSLQPGHDRYFELRIARWLAQRGELDFRLVQLLLEATRASGQAAAFADPHAPREESLSETEAIEQADRLRLAAERQMFTAAAGADRDALIASLNAALGAYRTAIADQQSRRTAERLAADVWRALPHYLAWNAAGGLCTSAELAGLLTDLAALEELLARGQPAAGEIREAAEALAKSRRQIERDLDPLAIEQLLGPPVSPGEGWRMELLLESPLPPAPVRAALTGLLAQIDAALASQIPPQPEPLSPTLAANRLRQDDERFFARAALQQQMWHAALRGVANPDREALDAALGSTGGRQGSLSLQRGNTETALADLLLGLPAQIDRQAALDADLSSAAGRPARRARLQAWQRALRLVDPRSAAAADIGCPRAALAGAAAYDLLAWLRQRAQRAGEDAPPQETLYQNEIASAYRAAAMSIPWQPPLDLAPASPIEISGPERLALTYEPRQTIELSIRNTTAAPQRVWLAGEWNAELIALGGGAAQSIYPWAELVAANGRPAPQRLAATRPSLELAANQSLRLPLTIERRRSSLYPSHLVLRALTEQHIARHDLAIALPPPEDVQLLVAGPAGRWTPGAAGLALHPFPNRLNSFALRLASGKPLDRQVDVELLPFVADPPHALPSGPLSAADAARLRQELSLGAVVGEAKGVALSGNGAPVGVLLAAPKAEPLPAPAAANGKTAPAPPKVDKPPPLPLTSGLLLVVTDQADQRQSFKWLRIEPQRPQRYIRPQVRYRAARERIEVRITAIDPSLLPDGGARLHADVLEPLPADAERQLDAVLRPGDAEANLHVEVPAAAGRVVTLRLSVDGYPRAIYYRVPCSGETSDVPEDLDLLAARIVELPQGTVYKPPLATIPVRIELDAPAGALNNPPLRVLAGLDRNRDRELRGDETLVLTADRQVTAALVEIDKAGQLAIDARVADFTLDLPAAALTSGRVNVLVQAILGDREAWSEPVEVVFDDQPPRTSAIELRPAGAVVIGQDLLVSALCDDLGLSGVAKMEVALDLERSGKFGPAAMPLAGALRDDGRWTAKLPTAGLASGSYNILVRAVDRAGNVGEPIRASANLLTQAEADAKKTRDNSADLTGAVVYGDQPQAGVTVSLVLDTGAPPPAGKGQAEPPPPLATATTDAGGRFKFAKVAPGKYVLTAAALVRNKNRRAQAPLAFQTPAEVQPVTLSLK